MRKFTSKRSALLAVVGLLAVSAVAVAYWTTTGSGSGSGSVKSANGTVTLDGVVVGALAPGQASNVTFTADNPGATDLRVGTIHLDSISASNPACNVSDFSMADVVANETVLHGATDQALSAVGSLAFANDPVNSQNACKGVTLTLTLSSN